MDRRKKVAFVMLYIVAGASILYGILYNFSPTIMPYHEEFLGKTHAGLDPRIAKLLLELMGLAGSGLFGTGITIIMLVRGPLRAGEKWAWWLVLFIFAGVNVPVFIRTVRIGWNSPWWYPGFVIILMVISLVLLRLKSKTNK